MELCSADYKVFNKCLQGIGIEPKYWNGCYWGCCSDKKCKYKKIVR